MLVADLDLSLIKERTGQRWIKTRRPELYRSLSIPTGEEDSHVISNMIIKRLNKKKFKK